MEEGRTIMHIHLFGGPGFPGIDLSQLFGEQETTEVTLPYKVVGKGERIGIQEVHTRYNAAADEAKRTSFGFDPIARCWAAVDTSGLRELRQSEHFDALSETVGAASDELSCSNDYRTRLLASHLASLSRLLERVSRIAPTDFSTMAHVGQLVIRGNQGELELLTPQFDAIGEQAFEALNHAQQRATQAAEAIMAPARAEYEASIRNGVLTLVAPVARRLGAEHGWEIVETPEALQFTRQVGGRKKTITIPLPSAAAPIEVPPDPVLSGASAAGGA